MYMDIVDFFFLLKIWGIIDKRSSYIVTLGPLRPQVFWKCCIILRNDFIFRASFHFYFLFCFMLSFHEIDLKKKKSIQEYKQTPGGGLSVPHRNEILHLSRVSQVLGILFSGNKKKRATPTRLKKGEYGWIHYNDQRCHRNEIQPGPVGPKVRIWKLPEITCPLIPLADLQRSCLWSCSSWPHLLKAPINNRKLKFSHSP